MWTPPLRESFAMPFLILQVFILTVCIRWGSVITVWLCVLVLCSIRQKSLNLLHHTALTMATLAFLLPWQFSQFVLVTQSLSLLCVHSLRLLPTARLATIYLSLTAALLLNIVLQFCNSLLLTLLPAAIISCLVSTSLHLWSHVKMFVC